jgi:PhnB protein
MTKLKTKPIPEGFHTITAYLTVRDCAAALELYKKALGATERYRMPGPGGKIMHAELQVGDSILMLGDEIPGFGNAAPNGTPPVSLFLYVPNVDEAFSRAVAAGCKSVLPPADQFWGARFGRFVDPFGHAWAIATQVEDVAPDEMERRVKQQAQAAPPPG